MSNVQDTEYRRYITGLFVIAGIIIGVLVFPNGVSFKGLSSQGLAGALAGLLILVLLVERTTEIAMIIWREADTEILKKKIGTFQTPVDSFQETSGDTQAIAPKTVNYFWPVLKGAKNQ